MINLEEMSWIPIHLFLNFSIPLYGHIAEIINNNSILIYGGSDHETKLSECSNEFYLLKPYFYETNKPIIDVDNYELIILKIIGNF